MVVRRQKVNAQHVSDVIYPSSGACDLFVISWIVLLWYDACWCYGVVRLGLSGILMQAEALLRPA